MNETTSRTLDPELFKRWLRDTGWSQRSQGPLGDLYELHDAVVAIPEGLSRDPEIAKGVAERVAKAMDRSVQDIWKRLRSPLTDRVELRLAGESLSSGRIPLGAASETLRNARRMLSSSGTSVITPARSISRRYRPEAQLLARDAELAHTEDGSFVFPLYVTLPTDEDTLAYDEGSPIIEPYERRVTRTLATALCTAVDLGTSSVPNLSDADLDEASSVGVSRELCTAMVDLLKHTSVERVDVNFEWSQAFASTESLPSSVVIHREVRPGLKALADRLATAEPLDPTVYSGDVLQIGRDQEDEGLFFFVLDTYHRASRKTLRVNLSAEQHAKAIHWYEDRATVIVRGHAVEKFSGLLTMSAPDRVEAWTSDRF